jgi:hypothetical protein
MDNHGTLDGNVTVAIFHDPEKSHPITHPSILNLDLAADRIKQPMAVYMESHIRLKVAQFFRRSEVTAIESSSRSIISSAGSEGCCRNKKRARAFSKRRAHTRLEPPSGYDHRRRSVGAR